MRLNSSIFPPGTCVMATPLIKNKSLPPFSRGFVQGYRSASREYPNIVLVDLGMVRMGKKGKDRFGRTTAAMCVFDAEMEKRDNSVFPFINTPKFKGFPFTHVVKSKCPTSTLELSDPEFIGWSCVYSLFLGKLYRNVKNRWPKKSSNPLNKMANIGAISCEDIKKYAEAYCHTGFREQFVNNARMLESSIPRVVLADILEKRRMELKAIAYLIHANMLTGEKLYDAAMLNSEYSKYRSRLISIANSIHKMDKIRHGFVLKNVKNGKQKVAKLVKHRPLPGIVKLRNVLTELVKIRMRPDFNGIFNIPLY